MRILIIVPPERTDFYSYLQEDSGNEYELLWFESEKEYLKSGISIPPFFKQQYFWDRFITPNQLLKKINPEKIIFFEIIDQRQIALITAAKNKGITTFYLEHGAAGSRETAEKRSDEIGFVIKKRIPYILQRFKSSAIQIFKSKFFYFLNVASVKTAAEKIKYLKLPFAMLKSTPNKVLASNLFNQRVPQYSIVFNKVNFYEYQLYTGINENQALFTGVPFFDKYFRPHLEQKNHIVYIDHPFVDEGLLDWTIEHEKKIAKSLLDFAKQYQKKIFIKLHPRSNITRWKSYQLDKDFIEIIQEGDFTDLYLSAKIILGYSSSLINGFLCAKKNVVLLGWHPEPSIFGNDFSKTGLCHCSYHVKEIFTQFSFWENNNLCMKDAELYKKFILEYNSPFDGKATQRVLNAINTL